MHLFLDKEAHMVIKKIIFNLINFFILCCLASWNLPAAVSRQPFSTSQESIDLKEHPDEKKEIKKQHKVELREEYKSSYLAHQKNRLAHFTDCDGFIWFDDDENKYTHFLSNFYPTSVNIWDMKFSCSESAFQAAKFKNIPELAVRFTHLDGQEAWLLAKKHSYQQRADWYQVREEIMLEILRTKFKQHDDLKSLLLATGNAYLVENSSRDAFWADGGDGNGKNRLGHLLMQIRGEFGGIGVVSKPAKYKKFVD